MIENPMENPISYIQSNNVIHTLSTSSHILRLFGIIYHVTNNADCCLISSQRIVATSSRFSWDCLVPRISQIFTMLDAIEEKVELMENHRREVEELTAEGFPAG